MAVATYRVTASSLNIRSGPSTDYKAVGSYKAGTIVNVYEAKNGWARVGTDRWCSMTYLSLISTDPNAGLAPSYVPTKDLENRPIYFMQTDSRWKNVMYCPINDKSRTIGVQGCGPTAACMIINEWFDKNYGPVECCDWSASAGYCTVNNGTYWSMMKALAVKFGCKFSQTASYDEAKDFLKSNKGSLIVCIMGKGNWTSSGHFILMYKCDNNYVYINDPASTLDRRQKNTAALLKSQCRQYFCFVKPTNPDDATSWADKTKEVDIAQMAFVVTASILSVRSAPTTSDGNNIVGTIAEGALVRATKKCGDWYYVTGTANAPITTVVNYTVVKGDSWWKIAANKLGSGARMEELAKLNGKTTKDMLHPGDVIKISTVTTDTANGKIISGWCPASYLSDANINNVNSDIASLVAEAINYLSNIKFLSNPETWRECIFDMDYLTNLMIAITNAVDSASLKSAGANKYTDVSVAIDSLNKIGVIASPDYWKNNYSKVKNVDQLIFRAAEWLC